MTAGLHPDEPLTPFELPYPLLQLLLDRRGQPVKLLSKPVQALIPVILPRSKGAISSTTAVACLNISIRRTKGRLDAIPGGRP